MLAGERASEQRQCRDKRKWGPKRQMGSKVRSVRLAWPLFAMGCKAQGWIGVSWRGGCGGLQSAERRVQSEEVVYSHDGEAIAIGDRTGCSAVQEQRGDSARARPRGRDGEGTPAGELSTISRTHSHPRKRQTPGPLPPCFPSLSPRSPLAWSVSLACMLPVPLGLGVLLPVLAGSSLAPPANLHIFATRLRTLRHPLGHQSTTICTQAFAIRDMRPGSCFVVNLQHT